MVWSSCSESVRTRIARKVSNSVLRADGVCLSMCESNMFLVVLITAAARGTTRTAGVRSMNSFSNSKDYFFNEVLYVRVYDNKRKTCRCVLSNCIVFFSSHISHGVTRACRGLAVVHLSDLVPSGHQEYELALGPESPDKAKGDEEFGAFCNVSRAAPLSSLLWRDCVLVGGCRQNISHSGRHWSRRDPHAYQAVTTWIEPGIRSQKD